MPTGASRRITEAQRDEIRDQITVVFQQLNELWSIVDEMTFVPARDMKVVGSERERTGT